MTNNLQLVITAADEAEIEVHVSALENIMGKYLHALTPAQRQELFQYGDKAAAFIDKVMEYALKYPDRVPHGVDFTESQRDYAVIQWGSSLFRRLTALAYDTESTVMLGRADITADVLAMYAQNRLDARNNVPGAQAAINEQEEHFVRRRKPAANNATPPAQ